MASNGCGCQTGILRWFKPPYSELFYIACEIHDNEYEKPGTETDRYVADIELFYNMTRCVDGCRFQPFKYWRMITVAMLYFVAVRIFGSNYFTYK